RLELSHSLAYNGPVIFRQLSMGKQNIKFIKKDIWIFRQRFAGHIIQISGLDIFPCPQETPSVCPNKVLIYNSQAGFRIVDLEFRTIQLTFFFEGLGLVIGKEKIENAFGSKWNLSCGFSKIISDIPEFSIDI